MKTKIHTTKICPLCGEVMKDRVINDVHYYDHVCKDSVDNINLFVDTIRRYTSRNVPVVPQMEQRQEV